MEIDQNLPESGCLHVVAHAHWIKVISRLKLVHVMFSSAALYPLCLNKLFCNRVNKDIQWNPHGVSCRHCKCYLKKITTRTYNMVSENVWINLLRGPGNWRIYFPEDIVVQDTTQWKWLLHCSSFCCHGRDTDKMAEVFSPPKFKPTDTNANIQLNIAWRDYKEELDIYFSAANLQEAEDERKVAILVYMVWMPKARRYLRHSR